MRPKIILHVGTEKTGSTSIQELLSANYESLVNDGVLFPSSIGIPCHINLTACALKNEKKHPIRQLLGLQDQDEFTRFVNKTKKNLQDEICNTSPRVMVISDEHINVHLSSTETLLEFKKNCEEFGDIISVVIYLRQQDEFRLSLFSEAVKAGNLSNFDLSNPLPIFDIVPYRLDYLSILDNLSEVFGQTLISPRIYDRRTFPNGDICADFLTMTGIDIKNITSTKTEKNKTIDAEVIKHLALISTALSSINKEWANKLRSEIIKRVELIFPGPGPVLHKEKHEKYLEQFLENNEKARCQYFKGSSKEQELFPNKYIENNSKKLIYPDCTVTWVEFFIKYVASNKEDENVVDKYSKKVNTISDELEEVLDATCTICGATYLLDIKTHSREGKLCSNCGASGRSQAIAYQISTITYGNFVPLKEHAVNKSIRIVGLSDGKVYADILTKKYNYTNTFYHQEPFLDITNPNKGFHNSIDILISTEVFEHVLGPSMAAFNGVYEILKPGGYMILTVPFVNKGDYIEHYREDLKDYSSYKTKDGKWVAELEYDDGHKEVDEEAKFHGGPGKTLEIRLFNRERILKELDLAGFNDVIIHDENMPNYGINWGPASRVITARKPLC